MNEVAITLCDILYRKVDGWMLIPKGIKMKVSPWYRECGVGGMIRVRSDDWVVVTEGNGAGCVLSRKLLEVSVEKRRNRWSGYC